MSRRLTAILGTSPELHRLSSRAAQLQALQRLYEQVAPPSLVRASHVLNLEQRVLLLAADNGAIAAKLRQLAPELSRLLRDSGLEVTGIQVRVQVTVPRGKAISKPLSVSNRGRESLADLAGKLADSPLKRALQRFAAKKD